MMVIRVAILALVISCIELVIPVWGVEVTPSNVLLPDSAGELFSFDIKVSDAMGVTAGAFQLTIVVSGPGVLTFDKAASEAIVSIGDYWVYGNSGGVLLAQDLGSNNYVFADNPNSPPTEDLIDGDIMARYAFEWDGTVGDYTFSLELDETKSFVFNAITFEAEPLEFNPGPYRSSDSNFIVTIPEPATLMLFATGIRLCLKRHKRNE